MTQTDKKTAAMLLTTLVCPVTKGPLIYDPAAQQLISPQIKKAFLIRSFVPIMLIEEAIDYDGALLPKGSL